ncbi:hypothetical protein [Psychrobacillus sp. MER TA 171]|uniref:hypothetical protein n=1 Tax=Psychrobacillus sp. MER TA 171 TaxID=2939577 RepID=UPI002040E38E|nr:hypothetical protein [Psychrobacillus sp. MER TA 171]MCM3358072.1 hypothetical protein [Psychrobacillus sp. MER TA 171]
MKKKILSLSLGLFLLTGTSAFAATGPINTTSSNTTVYDFNDGEISSMSGTVTSYAVDTIKSKNLFYRGGTLLSENEEVDYNNHFVLAYSPDFKLIRGFTYYAAGIHTVIHNGVTYTHSSSKVVEKN